MADKQVIADAPLRFESVVRSLPPDNQKELVIGSAGEGKTRTCWDLILTLGIPFSRRGASPFICSPVPFPVNTIEKIGRENKEGSEVVQRRPHPFELARR